MDKQALTKARADVIERFINLECIIGAIICQHYFGRVCQPFYLEVLYDEYCSFALKRRILEKIVPNLDRAQLENLNRLNTIRNYFAHTGPEIFEGQEIPSEGQEGFVPDPRKPSKAVDYAELYREFQTLEPGMTKYLFNLYQQLGGQYSKA